MTFQNSVITFGSTPPRFLSLRNANLHVREFLHGLSMNDAREIKIEKTSLAVPPIIFNVVKVDTHAGGIFKFSRKGDATGRIFLCYRDENILNEILETTEFAD